MLQQALKFVEMSNYLGHAVVPFFQIFRVGQARPLGQVYLSSYHCEISGALPS
jgi:hypothetical protein